LDKVFDYSTVIFGRTKKYYTFGTIRIRLSNRKKGVKIGEKIPKKYTLKISVVLWANGGLGAYFMIL